MATVRVFYSHPKKLYGTAAEKREVSLIEARFPGCDLVNPRESRPAPEPGGETEYYLRMIDSCDCLVFSRHYGYVTEGVRPEVDHALARGIPVFEVSDGRVAEVRGQVSNLPITARLILRVKGAFGIGR